MATTSSQGRAAAAPASASAPPMKYSVLYYQRKKKVHTNRGVSKMDGVLTVTPPPSCLVTLSSGDADDDDDGSGSDEEEEEGLSWKERQKIMRKRKSKGNGGGKKIGGGGGGVGRVSSGINWDVSKRAFLLDENRAGINEDDLVMLGGYECQIVAVLSGSGGDGKRGSGGPPKSLAAKKGPVGGGGTMTKRKSVPLQSRKSFPSRGGIGGNPAASKKPTIGRAATATAVRRVPPPQPKRQRFGDSDSDSGYDDELGDDETLVGGHGHVPPPSSSVVPASLQSRGRRRVVAVSKTSATTAASAAAAAPGTTDFPGAIGAVTVPPSVCRILRPHQRVGVSFLWNCLTGASPALLELSRGRRRRRRDGEDDGEEDDEGDDDDDGGMANGGGGGSCCHRGVVLADEPGLGKTLMTIATVCALHRRDRSRRFVVVCPSSLVGNWAKEFDKWIGRASQPTRIVVGRGGEVGAGQIRGFVPVKPHRSEVLILSYEMARMHSAVLSQAASLGLLVVDEGHRLKNTSGSQTLTALRGLTADGRLLITGTPIQNNLSEFYNVVDFVNPGILGDLSSFRRDYDRPISSANTKAATRDQKARGRAQSKALEAITSAFMLRRLQKDILKTLLPPRAELLLFCRPSDVQCRIYRELTAGVVRGGGVGATDALTLLTNVRKLCSHPHLLSDDVSAGADFTASSKGNPSAFRGGTDSVRGNRGIARGRVGIKSTNKIGPVASTSRSSDSASVALSGKLAVLDRLLASVRESSPTDKVVVVSNFTTALTLIENALLRPRGWSSVRLDGSVEQRARQDLVDSFNRGSVERSFVFLLSSKAGGCGLNLIGGNRLVLFDPDWNPATDLQAMARVYRQGQTKPCFIYRLFTSGTVEEVIYQRQIQKGNLAALAVDGKSTSSKTEKKKTGFTDEELRDCFTLKEGCACDTKEKVGGQWREYDGSQSLHSAGCTDEALLTVADEHHDLLSFVHVCEDVPGDGNAPNSEQTSGKDTESTGEFSEESDSSDDEEIEF